MLLLLDLEILTEVRLLGDRERFQLKFLLQKSCDMQGEQAARDVDVVATICIHQVPILEVDIQ